MIPALQAKLVHSWLHFTVHGCNRLLKLFWISTPYWSPKSLFRPAFLFRAIVILVSCLFLCIHLCLAIFILNFCFVLTNEWKTCQKCSALQHARMKPSFYAHSVYNLENWCFRVLCLAVWTADNFYSLSSILIVLDAQLWAGCFKR